MEFPSEQLGDRIMQVNAIPEYNEFQEMESVLVVSHDITARKVIEMEIQAKNKKDQRFHQLCPADSGSHSA